MILEKKNNTIFIFETFNPVYFILLKDAKELEFQCEDYIKLIKNDKIEKIKNDDQQITNGRNNFSVNQSKNYLKLSLTGKTPQEKINRMSNYSKKIISLGIKKTMQKYSLMNENELQDKILNQVYNKIKKLNLKNLDCLFFVTAAREDLYLKPWFPIFEKFDGETNDYLVITSDLVTSLTLSKQNIPSVSIFEEVKLLEEKIPLMKIGQEFREFLEFQNREGRYWSEFSELFNDILKKGYRTIALTLIINNFFDKEKIRSIVAGACGEILENTAISISKKFNVPSFSMLSVGITPPFPWFSNWFKTDKIFVYGLNGKNDLTALGYKNDRIIISGNPKLDKFVNVKVNDAKKLLETQYPIDSKKKLIVIAMSRWHKNDELWMSDLIKFCNEKKIEIIIKIHQRFQGSSNQTGRS